MFLYEMLSYFKLFVCIMLVYFALVFCIVIIYIFFFFPCFVFDLLTEFVYFSHSFALCTYSVLHCIVFINFMFILFLFMNGLFALWKNST